MNEDQTDFMVNFKNEVIVMCDYSLHQYRSRLALGGETLIVYRFPSVTLGLASPSDLQAIVDEKANRRSPRFRLAIVDFFSAPVGEKIPGAQLRLLDIPTRLRRKPNVREEEEVVFTQLSSKANERRDAARFRNGRAVLSQQLEQGQRVYVISTSLPDEPPDREWGAASARYVQAARPETVGQLSKQNRSGAWHAWRLNQQMTPARLWWPHIH
jgi:hypothetical protein